MQILGIAQSIKPPDLPSPEDRAHEPGSYISGVPNWWSKLYIPMDSGGKSKVPMPDGLMIAQSQSMRTAHKNVPWDNAETLGTPDGEWPAQEKVPFKPGTDEEYLESEKTRLAGGDNPNGQKETEYTTEVTDEEKRKETENELLSTSAAAYGGSSLPGSAAETSKLPGLLRR